VTNVAVFFWNSREVHDFIGFVQVFFEVFKFGELLLRETDSQFIACGGKSLAIHYLRVYLNRGKGWSYSIGFNVLVTGTKFAE
jgi:hypothetical protein